jgi:glycerol uptake facilitator protein
MATGKPALPAWLVGEFIGTFMLVFFGCGSVAAAVLTGAQVGIFQVAIVWGIGIATAIYLTGGLSGAHLNPAVTCGFAAAGRIRWRAVPGYVMAQCAGAFCASATLYALFAGPLRLFEAANHITRGAPGSEASAMIFGEYFPNPAWHHAVFANFQVVTPGTAFLAEALGTSILVLVILCVTDERNASRPGPLTAVTVGLTITILISLIGPLTMAGFNPARDFAPRLFSAFAGWGALPFRANGLGWLVVYIIAPLAGGQAGSLAYRWLFRPYYQVMPVIR